MPGIVGLITKLPAQQAEEQLRRMVSALRHENFYTVGTWMDESLGVYVGWVARRDSNASKMPIQSEHTGKVLVFSGEEFPTEDTITRLRQDGHVVGSNSLSYLIQLAESDEAFPRILNGWFHGVLVDRRRGTITVFNDRFGMQRLYYYETAEAFYFSAEAKAILSVRTETRDLDMQALAELMTCGFPLEGRTLFPGVRVLPEASNWRFRDGRLMQADTYFEPSEWDISKPLGQEEYYQELKSTFSRILPWYFSGPHKVAMSLTGGLDGRMIMAWYRGAAGTLPCYTFGGMFRECRDVSLGREVARACGQPHSTIEINEEFLSQFPKYAERTIYLTDGYAEISHSPDLYAHAQAREIAPVRMTGNYGGEVLRDVWSFKPWEPPKGFFKEEFAPLIQRAIMAYRTRNRHSLSTAIFRGIPTHFFGTWMLDQTQVTLRSPYLDNELIKVVLRRPHHNSQADAELCHRLVFEGNALLSGIPLDRMQGMGGASAAFRGRVLEFLFKAEYAYDIGMPHWLARLDHSVSWLKLEKIYLGRHKWYHFRTWYKEALSTYVREILLDRRTLSRPYLNPEYLECIVKRHLSGMGNHTGEIHKLLTIELIQRQLVESPY